MKSDWIKIKIGDCVDLLTGFPFKSEFFTHKNQGIPLVKGENLHQGYIDWEDAKYWPRDKTNNLEKYWLEKDDVVLAMDRPWIEAGLKCSWIKSNYPQSLLVQRVSRLRGKDNLSTKYLRYIIASPFFTNYIKPIVTGVNVPHISPDQIKSYEFNLPPLPTQIRIVSILSAYDELIENNTRRIKILEEMAKLIYREWFVEFKAPEVKLRKATAEERKVTGKELFPEGWEVVKLNKMYKTSSGSTPSRGKKEYYTDGDILWVKTKELRDSFIFETEEKINDEGFNNSSTKLFPKNTVIMAMYGATIGRLGILARPATTNQACCAFAPLNEIYSFPYLYLYLFLNRETIFSLGTGAAQQNVSQDVIKEFEMVKPDNNSFQQFNSVVVSLFELIETLQQKNHNLRSTRDVLLPKLVNGEIEA